MSIQALAQYLEDYKSDQYFSLSSSQQRIFLADLESSLYPVIHLLSSTRDYVVFHFHRLEQLLFIALRNEMRVWLDKGSLTDQTATYYSKFLEIITNRSSSQIFPLLEHLAKISEDNDEARLIKAFAARILRVWNPEKLVQVLEIKEQVESQSAQTTLVDLRERFRRYFDILRSPCLVSDSSLCGDIRQCAQSDDLEDVLVWLSQVERAMSDGYLQKEVTSNVSHLKREHGRAIQQLRDLTAAKLVCEGLVPRIGSDPENPLLLPLIQDALTKVKGIVEHSARYNELLNLTRFIPGIDGESDQEVRCHYLSDFTRAIEQCQVALECSAQNISVAEQEIKEAEQARTQYVTNLRAQDNQEFKKAMSSITNFLGAVDIAMKQNAESVPGFLRTLKEDVEAQAREKVIQQAQETIQEIDLLVWHTIYTVIAEDKGKLNQEAHQSVTRFDELYSRYIRSIDRSEPRQAALAIEVNEQMIVNNLLMPHQDFDRSFGDVRLAAVDFTQLPMVRLPIGEECLEFTYYDFQTILLVALRNELRALQDSAEVNREVLQAYQYLLNNLRDRSWVPVGLVSNVLANISGDSAQSGLTKSLVITIQRFWNSKSLVNAYDTYQSSGMIQPAQSAKVKECQQFANELLEIFINHERLLEYRSETFLQSLRDYANRAQALGLTQASKFLTELLPLLVSLKTIETQYLDVCQPDPYVEQRFEKAKKKEAALNYAVEVSCPLVDPSECLHDFINKSLRHLYHGVEAACQRVNPKFLPGLLNRWQIIFVGNFEVERAQLFKAELKKFLADACQQRDLSKELIDTVMAVSHLVKIVKDYEKLRHSNLYLGWRYPRSITQIRQEISDEFEKCNLENEAGDSLYGQAVGQLRVFLTSQLYVDAHHEVSQFHRLMNEYLFCLEVMPAQVMAYCERLKEEAQQKAATQKTNRIDRKVSWFFSNVMYVENPEVENPEVENPEVENSEVKNPESALKEWFRH